MKRALVALTICIAFAAAVFLPTIQPVEASSGQQALTGGAIGLSAAGDYCVQHGGVVENRQPYYNTNGDPKSWLRLSGSQSFCVFTSQADGSQINVLLSTLNTTKPSLAALAYYAQTPEGSCTGNPASCYCSLLGGSDLFGGVNAAGGGWVNKKDPVNPVLEACIFPDMSSIDSWGLLYYAYGIVRGADLNGILRYQNPYASKKQ